MLLMPSEVTGLLGRRRYRHGGCECGTSSKSFSASSSPAGDAASLYNNVYIHMYSHSKGGARQGGVVEGRAKIAVKDFFSFFLPHSRLSAQSHLSLGRPSHATISPSGHGATTCTSPHSPSPHSHSHAPPRPFLRPRKCHPQSCPKRTGMAVGADSLPIHLPSSARLHAPPEHDIECLIPAVVGRWWRLWVLLFFLTSWCGAGQNQKNRTGT